MSITAASPRLMVGVPTGFLSPQIPPPNQFVTTVGIEIEPGLGISVDGKAILVGPKNAGEQMDIIGHLSDGTYPQRDFHVTRQGLQSLVRGHFQTQNYDLTSQGQRLDVKGPSERESFSANYRSNGFDIQAANPQHTARSYTVNVDGSQATVVPAWNEGTRYHITQEGNTTRVDAGNEDLNFTFTRNGDGTITLDGKLNTQDFNIRPEGSGMVLQGHFPQQHYVISKS